MYRSDLRAIMVCGVTHKQGEGFLVLGHLLFGQGISLVVVNAIILQDLPVKAYHDECRWGKSRKGGVKWKGARQ